MGNDILFGRFCVFCITNGIYYCAMSFIYWHTTLQTRMYTRAPVSHLIQQTHNMHTQTDINQRSTNAKNLIKLLGHDSDSARNDSNWQSPRGLLAQMIVLDQVGLCLVRLTHFKILSTTLCKSFPGVRFAELRKLLRPTRAPSKLRPKPWTRDTM